MKEKIIRIFIKRRDWNKVKLKSINSNGSCTLLYIGYSEYYLFGSIPLVTKKTYEYEKIIYETSTVIKHIIDGE